MPTNRVTGDGSATVHLNGDVASVTVDTNGLLNGQPHAMHIHAGGKGLCPPASAARLHNGNRAISTTNGIPFYGPPRVSLTTTGDTSPASRVALPRYPDVGDIRYTRAVTVPAGVAAAIRAGNAVIVVHGIDYDHNGIYDNILDRSELDSSLPGEATAPALCGKLVPTKNASISGGTTYAVTFHRTVVAAVAHGSSLRAAVPPARDRHHHGQRPPGWRRHGYLISARRRSSPSSTDAACTRSGSSPAT